MLKIGVYKGKEFINKLVIEDFGDGTVICDYFTKDKTRISFTAIPIEDVEQDIIDYNLKYVDNEWD